MRRPLGSWATHATGRYYVDVLAPFDVDGDPKWTAVCYVFR